MGAWAGARVHYKRWKKTAVENRGCFTLVRIEIKAGLIDVEMLLCEAMRGENKLITFDYAMVFLS